MQAPGFAQAQISGVEVNFETLGPLENYVPPPMFDGPAPSKTEPPIPSSIEKKVPRPGRKPYHKKRPYTDSAPVKPVAAASLAPLPPQRPKTFHASKSFVAQARKDFLKTMDTEPSAASKINEKEGISTDITEKDPLFNALLTPSAEDVLSTIDNAKKKPPRDQKQDNDYKISIEYQTGESAMPEHWQSSLSREIQDRDARLSSRRLEIQGFATTNGQDENSARRLSLSRVLGIRSYLISNNIDPDRIDIRPMGDRTSLEPKDRVDILFIEEDK